MPFGELLTAPVVMAGTASKGVQAEKKDVFRKLPPAPWDLKPSGLGLPSPEDVFQDVTMRVREVVSFPLQLIESGEIPHPPQVIGTLENKRPLERVKRHVRSIPTPFEVFKDTIGKDIVTPREAARDMERAMEDLHVFAEDMHEMVMAQYPVTIENIKQSQANLTAMRHAAVDFMQAGGKALTRMAKSAAKMMEDFADGGLTGLVF